MRQPPSPCPALLPALAVPEPAEGPGLCRSRAERQRWLRGDGAAMEILIIVRLCCNCTYGEARGAAPIWGCR